jgi:uncharacterized protein YuzB (UPF0349 family)
MNIIKSSQSEKPISLSARVYLLLPARVQRLLLLRAALARAAAAALLLATLNLRPVQADVGPFTLYNPLAVVTVGRFNKPAFADLDNDGDLDALVGAGNGNLHYFENTGSASSPAFAALQTNPFGLADVGSDSAPALADLDNDGDLDALVGAGDGDLHYFENTGSASSPAFAAPLTNPFGLANAGVYSIPALADLDNDGDLDAVVGAGGGDLHYFRNTGSPGSPVFAAALTNPFGLANIGYESAPTLADLDNDGDLDALIGDFYGTLRYFRNTGSPSSPAFAAPLTNPLGLADIGRYAVPAFTDLDNDGDFDVVVGEYYGRPVYFRNTGSANSPAFTAIRNSPFDLNEAISYSIPIFADLDGDGDLDALVGEYYGFLEYSENTGNANSPSFPTVEINPFGLGVGYNSAPALADLDDDGDLDALIGGLYGNLSYFENTGSASSPDFPASVTNPFGLANVGSYSIPTLADLDNDGDLDVLVGELYGDLHYFENTGSANSPTFAAAVINPFGLGNVGYHSAPALADLDGDGDLDALVGAEDGKLYYFENTGDPGNPAFAAAQTNPFGLADIGYHSAPTLTDLDGDGDLDVVVGEAAGSLIYFSDGPFQDNSPHQVYLPLIRKTTGNVTIAH